MGALSEILPIVTVHIQRPNCFPAPISGRGVGSESFKYFALFASVTKYRDQVGSFEYGICSLGFIHGEAIVITLSKQLLNTKLLPRYTRSL